MKNDFGFEKVYSKLRMVAFVCASFNTWTLAVNRLDRLTSGLMILPLNPALATTLSKEFVNGEVRKEYVARCKGKFPEYVIWDLWNVLSEAEIIAHREEIVCEEPLLTVDRQMGLNIVHPEGKVRICADQVRIHADGLVAAREDYLQPLALRREHRYQCTPL